MTIVQGSSLIFRCKAPLWNSWSNNIFQTWHGVPNLEDQGAQNVNSFEAALLACFILDPSRTVTSDQCSPQWTTRKNDRTSSPAMVHFHVRKQVRTVPWVPEKKDQNKAGSTIPRNPVIPSQIYGEEGDTVGAVVQSYRT